MTRPATILPPVTPTPAVVVVETRDTARLAANVETRAQREEREEREFRATQLRRYAAQDLTGPDNAPSLLATSLGIAR
jgi:hypothetical protein